LWAFSVYAFLELAKHYYVAALKKGLEFRRLGSHNVGVDRAADLIGVIPHLIAVVEIHVDGSQNIIHTECEDALIEIIHLLRLLSRNIVGVLEIVGPHDCLEVVGPLGINDVLLAALEPDSVAYLCLQVVDICFGKEGLIHRGSCMNADSRLLIELGSILKARILIVHRE
jgi:hypothetical protein